MINYQIKHVTTYTYGHLASLSYSEARLLPRSFELPTFSQQVIKSSIETSPQTSDRRDRIDFFGNQVSYFSMRTGHKIMSITANSHVLLQPTPLEAQRQFSNPSWELVRDWVQEGQHDELLSARQYTLPSPIITALADVDRYSAESFHPERPILDSARELMARIYTDFDYVPGTTTIATPLSEVAEKKRGVCQDYAHFMIACLRCIGLPARYVSGYIENVPPEGEEKLEGSDASHAWISLYIPGLGWYDFDPTNNLVPHDQHITVAWGRDFTDVTPLKGVLFSSGQHTLSVSVDVRRLT